MKRFLLAVASVALLSITAAVHADVFSLGAGYTNLQTAFVGDAGNTGELAGRSAGGNGSDRICGSVAYAFNVGKYEVTARQYADFLNNKAKFDGDVYGLYNPFMSDVDGAKGCNIQRSGAGTAADPYTYSVASDWANRPVNYVSYWDACRFANWLGNGQGNGSTETGGYTLNGYSGDDGREIQRNANWAWAVTSEDEWYKAAYYKGGGLNAGYWDYTTSNDTAPGRDLTDASGNNANYWTTGYLIGAPYYATNAGEFQNSVSPYGTFDQGGNVWEWNESVSIVGSYAYRGRDGGSFFSYVAGLSAANRGAFYSTDENSGAGFRVVQAVPEPSSFMGLVASMACLPLLLRRRRE